MKINNKGFALIELLVAATIMMILFTTTFLTISPKIDKISKNISYTSVDNNYFLFHIRKLYINEEFNIQEGEYITLYNGNTCTNISKEKEEICNNLLKEIETEELILTNSNIKKLKQNYKGKLKEYINYLPNTKENNNYLLLILKTKTGYASSPLYTDLPLDKEGPECAFDKNYTDNKLVLNCTDKNSFKTSDILPSSFIIDNNIKITNIEKQQQDKGYKYLIEIDTTLKNFTIKLKENTLQDIYNNSNKEVLMEVNL